MKKKIISKIFLFLSSILLITLFSYTIDAGIENKKINELIDDFKKNATFYQYSEYYDTNFYKVKNSQIDITPTFTILEDVIYPGFKGDILTTLKNEVGVEPFTSMFSFYFGGHAAMVKDSYIIQTAGNSPTNNCVSLYPNNWLRDHTKRYRFIALKVNTSLENRENACDQTIKWLGKKYNYSFIFDTKDKFYCTDLISRAYKQIDKSINLNEDKFSVSVQDLITSKNTFISIYKEKNENINNLTPGNYNLYYLDDGIGYNFD